MTLPTNCPVCGDTNIDQTTGCCLNCGQNTTYTSPALPVNEAPSQGKISTGNLEGSV
jgi:hypothetical protein